MKTASTKPSDIKRQWHILDASDQILGRLSTQIATKLIGKHKPYYTPHLDCGDYVIVINTDKIQTTGGKTKKKVYYHHSGYPGGLKAETLGELMTKNSTRVIELAVKNMLPKNKLRSPRLRRLKVFTGSDHPYTDKLQSQS